MAEGAPGLPKWQISKSYAKHPANMATANIVPQNNIFSRIFFICI
jgi:hypothetical protein